MTRWTPDPTFYPSPRLAAKAPAETLAYVAAFAPKRDVPAPAVLGALALLTLESGALGGGGLLGTWGEMKNGLRNAVDKDPLDALAVTVLGGAAAFYQAERGHNPKIRNVYDAVCFISTCLSVGYDQTFAQTPKGKAIASVIMTIGRLSSAAVSIARVVLPVPAGPR